MEPAGIVEAGVPLEVTARTKPLHDLTLQSGIEDGADGVQLIAASAILEAGPAEVGGRDSIKGAQDVSLVEQVQDVGFDGQVVTLLSKIEVVNDAHIRLREILSPAAVAPPEQERIGVEHADTAG